MVDATTLEIYQNDEPKLQFYVKLISYRLLLLVVPLFPLIPFQNFFNTTTL